VRWAEDASDNEPNMRLARELHVRRALVTATGNAAEGIRRGNIRGGREPLAGGTRTGCRITPHTSHVPAGLAAHMTDASGMTGGAERRSWSELLKWGKWHSHDWRFSRLHTISKTTTIPVIHNHR
jgi:hypothetical protein